ncbi:MAG: efflux RND transporter periplasmic adaptor subunit [Anaerolineae bacterium]
MKRGILWIAIIAVIAAAVGGVIWWRNRTQDQATAEILRTTEVVRDDLQITTPASGNVIVSRRADLSFPSTGRITAVHIEVGDRVKGGDELARLDDTTLRDAIHQAELTLAQAELSLETLLAPAGEDEVRVAELAIREAVQAMEVAKTSQQLAEARAQQNEERAQRLADDAQEAYETYLDTLDRFGLPEAFAAGVTAAYMEASGNVGVTAVKSEHAIEQARSQWLSAYQRYEQATDRLERLQGGPDEAQIRKAELQIEQAKVGLAQAQADLASARLTAPFGGVIAAVNIQAGTVPPTARPAITLLDDTALYVDLSVDELDIGTLREGQSVQVVLDAYPDATLEGLIDRIGLLPESIGGVIGYPVRVALTDTAGIDVRDGMTASATVITGVREQVLLVPNWAVRTDQSSEEIYTYCHCVEDDVPRRVPIEVGARNDTFTEIISGLNEGQVVALVAETTDLLEMRGPPSQGQP